MFYTLGILPVSARTEHRSNRFAVSVIFEV